MIHAFVFLIAAFFLMLGIYFRMTRGSAPLRQYGNVPLPGFPGPIGLVARLDGLERRQREVVSGYKPNPRKDGGITLPKRWEGDMTTGRMACVAHNWALSQLIEEDPEGGKARESAVARATVIVVFAILVALALVFVRHVQPRTALMLIAGTWSFLVFIAIPTQYREWKARDLAKARLRETGLWPLLPHDRAALEVCLNAMIWCRVAGFRRILPR